VTARPPSANGEQAAVPARDHDPSAAADRLALTIDLRDPPVDGVPASAGFGQDASSVAVPAPADRDEPDFQRLLGARLRGARRALRLRLQDVELRSGGRFKAVVVGSYERGDRAIAAHRLAALADFYGVPVSELLPEDPWPRRAASVTGHLVLDVGRCGTATGDDIAPLRRVVEHVRWLRSEQVSQVMSLRREDLRTVAIALGVRPEELPAWLEERGLLAKN
jgi:hypothetical protein